ncbi:hypothetical protein D917_09283, partial [Trichinella nativa]
KVFENEIHNNNNRPSPSSSSYWKNSPETLLNFYLKEVKNAFHKQTADKCIEFAVRCLTLTKILYGYTNTTLLAVHHCMLARIYWKLKSNDIYIFVYLSLFFIINKQNQRDIRTADLMVNIVRASTKEKQQQDFHKLRHCLEHAMTIYIEQLLDKSDVRIIDANNLLQKLNMENSDDGFPFYK